MRVVACTFLLFFAGGITLNPAMAEDAMTTASMAKAKFGNFPVLPKCAMISVASGDPSQGAAMVMAKASSGCVIPWHWHTAREQLMFVTGTAKVEMKDGAPAHLHSGDYINLPSKNVHQFTCSSACSFFLATDGAFDIHYVDATGHEISAEDALKAKLKAPGRKPASKADMK
ncbi:MAG TPA: cupin domain-containing protein [Terriglobales bacterium]|jgi:quercetin dioxygenase-like cupin family protein|nr:cupin domain-containing protein [Terriglobales bacterium]